MNTETKNNIYQNSEYTKDRIHKAGFLWETIRNSWKEGVNVVNPKEILRSEKIKMFIALCPLYTQGQIHITDLIAVTQGKIQNINDAEELIMTSRVGKKLLAYKAVIASLAVYIPQNTSLDLHASFADQSVLLARNPQKEDNITLSEHQKAYELVFKSLCKQYKINLTFTAFSMDAIPLLRFVNPQDQVKDIQPCTANEILNMSSTDLNYITNRFISLLNNERQDKLGLPVPNTNDTRKATKDLIRKCGTSSAYWLAQSYALSDPFIAKTLGQNGIYIIAERLGELHKMVRFTPNLRQSTRIEIMA